MPTYALWRERGNMKQVFTWVGRVRGQGRPRFGNGHAYESEGDVDYKRAIRDMYVKKGCGYFGAAPISVTIDVVRHLPIGTPKRIASMYDLQKPDVDNIAKSVLDALNGVAWDDDKQVVFLLVRKFPRVHMDDKIDYLRVTISDVDQETIFPYSYIPE